MATIEYLSNKLDVVLSNVFKHHTHNCKKIKLIYSNTKEEIILYSLKDVVKYFLRDENINEIKLLETNKNVTKLIDDKNKYLIKDLKNKHKVSPNMTIESYINYQTLLDFKESEMNDIYVDKIGLYKALIIIQPNSIKTFKDFTLNVLLDTLDKKTTKEEPITEKIYEKLNYLINVINSLTDSNKELIEKNHYLTKKNQILDKNIEALQKDVAKTKEVLIEMFNELINVNAIV